MMRVVIAAPEYPPHSGGGIGQFYATLAPALVRAGCDVSVVVAAAFSDGFAPYDHDGVVVHPVARAAIDAKVAEMPHLSAAPVFRRWIAAAQAAHDTACALSPDCIETTDFGLHFVPFVAAPAPCPIVVQCHGSLGQIGEREPDQPHLALDFSLARLAEATLLPYADDVQTSARANAGEWSARLNRAVTVVPPPFAGRERAADGSSVTDGLVVGRIQIWKGPGVLCEALRAVPRMPPIRWVGRDTETAPDGGSLSDFLRGAYPDVWGIRIDPTGPLAHAEVAVLQRRARFVIVPSSWDVYNLTAAEAMHAGRVVICSDGAGASDLIESGRNGFLFTAGDPRSLAAALDRAIDLTPDERASMGARASETVSQRLDPAANARQRVQRFGELVARGPAARHAAPDWVRGFFSGREATGGDRAFLDHVSLRDLSRYLSRRASERLLTRAGLRPERPRS
jgi:glycosyltransferase involved in cell wall biosynthesis